MGWIYLTVYGIPPCGAGSCWWKDHLLLCLFCLLLPCCQMLPDSSHSVSGSWRNLVAEVPNISQLGETLFQWICLSSFCFLHLLGFVLCLFSLLEPAWVVTQSRSSSFVPDLPAQTFFQGCKHDGSHDCFVDTPLLLAFWYLFNNLSC